MSFFRRRMPQDREHEAEPSGLNGQGAKRNQTLDWEFGSDDLGALFDSTRDVTVTATRDARRTVTVLPAPAAPQVRTVSPIPAPTQMAQTFRGEKAANRVSAVRQTLNRALEQWWGKGELPPTELLRDGLLVLEAGHDLSESQLTLVLRTALLRGKGMLTALRHQTDGERTAMLLKEALFDPTAQLAPATLRQLREQDENNVEWAPLLIADLVSELPTLVGAQRQLAIASLAELKSNNLSATLLADLAASSSPFLPSLDMLGASWSRFRIVMFILLMLGFVTVYLWRHGNFSATETIMIPAGKYNVGDATGAARMVDIGAFVLEQTEVTNAQYRRCYQLGYCPEPSQNASATHPHYFLDPTFDTFPVIQVDWDGARAFCTWVGRRLPTADEWEVAANFAPATQRVYRFPWGNEFDALLANSQATAGKDTQTVGYYHPAGDSPLGLRDMAGNVAEWTATASDGEESYIVKGGSFQDQPAALQTSAQQSAPRETAAPWLGFRCAARSR